MEKDIKKIVDLAEKSLGDKIINEHKMFSLVESSKEKFIFRFGKSIPHHTDYLICKYPYKNIHQPFKFPFNDE